MSLAQHVTSVEGIDRTVDEDLDVSSLILTKTLSHKLSYDILPRFVDLPIVPEKLDSVGAYEISQGRRISQIVVGCISCGFAALKAVLVDEKVYRELCTAHELEKDVVICYLQDQRCVIAFLDIF